MSGLGVVHLLYKVLRDLVVWYRLCTHSLSALFLSDYEEPYKYVQEVYKNPVHSGWFSTDRCTAMRDLEDVHLVYKALRALPVSYSLYTHSQIQLFGPDFGEPYRSVQQVYEYAVRCRLFSTAW